MADKQRYTVSLPRHVTAEIEKRAKVVDATPTEYAADILRWWFGQGCPPVTHDEVHLHGTRGAEGQQSATRRISRLPANLSIWQLDPEKTYVIQNDEVVRPLMVELGIPNLFAQVQEHDEVHSFVAFDNHPSHWIILNLWKGLSNPEGNGLLLEAEPKSQVKRSELLARLKRRAARIDARQDVAFSQLPKIPSATAASRHPEPTHK